MAGYFLLGTFAAFGVLSILWALLGWLLPAGKGCAVVCFGPVKPESLVRFRWLRSLGLLTCPVIVVSSVSGSLGMETENCNEEELLHRLKREWEQYHGTGAGDSPGCHQRRGVSEL